MKKIFLLMALISFQACAAEKYDEYKSYDWHCVGIDEARTEVITYDHMTRGSCEAVDNAWRWLSDHERDDRVNAAMDKAE